MCKYHVMICKFSINEAKTITSLIAESEIRPACLISSTDFKQLK